MRRERDKLVQTDLPEGRGVEGREAEVRAVGTEGLRAARQAEDMLVLVDRAECNVACHRDAEAEPALDEAFQARPEVAHVA